MKPLYPKKPGVPGVVVRVDLTRREARILSQCARRHRFWGQSTEALLRAYIKSNVLDEVEGRLYFDEG